VRLIQLMPHASCLMPHAVRPIHFRHVFASESHATIRGMKFRTIAVVIVLAATAAIASAKEVLPFVENDYSKALARAEANNLPMFVDAWAPW
jgi:hypothetical protein